MLKLKPRSVFLVDSIGAFVTTLVMMVFCTSLHEVLGLNQESFLVLANFALVYSIYSIICYKFVKTIKPVMILLIMGANLFHSFILVPILLLLNEPTSLAFAYFVLEATVISFVVLIERQAYREIKAKA